MTTIKNNKEEIPLQYYLDAFKDIDPVQRSKELVIPYENSCFRLSMYGDAYTVRWPDAKISCENTAAMALNRKPAQIMLLRYLISGKPLPSTGRYLAFRELPWGNVYLQPFTGRCLNRMAWKYNSDPEAFCKAALSLGGQPLDHADAGFRFEFIGDYNLLFYLWKGDEEFPPNAQVEYSDNFAAGFQAEDSVVAAELLIGAISAEMKKAL